MKKASCVVPSLLCVKLTRDDKWGQYVYSKCHEYRKSTRFMQKTLVVMLGKQQDDNIWVLSPDVQIDSSGNLIPVDQHKYYWDDEYARQHNIKSLKISLPLNPMVCFVS